MIVRILVLILGVLFTACIDFRMDDEAAKKELDAVPIQFGDLKVEDRTMHYAYSCQGKAQLAVFVHGSPGSWDAFIDFFKADSLLKDMDILAIDRPGFGSSDYGKAEASLSGQALLIKAVTDQFDHPVKILVGHSLGGPVIARMAMDNPGAFDGLILVAPSIDPEQEKDEWYRKMIATKFGAFFTPKALEVSNEEIMGLKEELTLMLPLWKEIRLPVVVIQGTRDQLVPKENADFAQWMIADSLLEVRLLEGVNHFIPWTHPEEISKAIVDLME